MQYIDSIIVHNFKSFKHANIKFSKGFNCIVGPNGSGKSNICDSLLFALGESSLKRMRVNNTALLINSNAKAKKEDGVKKAYVKINLEGGTPLEVARIIKSNNKIGYRLNSKKVTRQELVDVLRSYRSEINDTNIIAQGEISYMVNLHSKERRELIDIAAGIKEFNDKKDTSMKELDKVQEKMNSAHIVLNERKGFLDQLEKEKEDAEKYLKLTDTIKKINYTALKNSEKQSESDFNTTTERVKTAEERKKEISAIISEADLMIEKFSKEKETLTKSLNERSVELSGTNKILENINKELAVKDTQSKSLKEKLSESEKQIEQSTKEKKRIKEEITIGIKEMETVQKELDEKSKLLSTKESYETESGSNSQINKISSNQKRIDELYLQEESLSKQNLQSKFEIETIEKSLKATSQELESKSAKHQVILSSLKEYSKKIQELETKISKASGELQSDSVSVQKCKKSLDEIYVNSVNLREQLAMTGGGTDKLNNLIKRNIQKGFYGRAYELCSYDEKYELAVNAAALNRLSYFVVESAEVADEAIQLIKSSQLGRASFIPIKDLTIKYKEENEKLDSLASHIKFESKFEKAFTYIFANTYIVENIEKAKKIGFGKGRFVTFEGEVIEQSGIISGGSKKHLQSPLMLESKLKSLESQKSAANQELNELESKLEVKRKEIGSYQTEILNWTNEIRHLEKESQTLGSEIESATQRSKNLSSKLLQVQNLSVEMDKKRNALIEELNVLKAENEKIYEINNSGTSKSKGKIDKTEIEKLKSLRAEVESLKIKIATLSKEQEFKKARFDEIEIEIKAKSEDNKETTKKLAILDNELMELEKSKNGLIEKIGKTDAHSQELYKKLQQ